MLTNVQNFRLQPIIKLSYGSPTITAYEILINLHNNEYDLEEFFKELPLIEFKKLFFFQAALCSRLHGCYHINAPLELLLKHYVSGVINNSNFSKIQPGKIRIEIQNPYQLFALSDLDLAEIRTEIRLLQEAGAEVWLDDICEIFYPLVMDLGVDGVKLDKNFFWNVNVNDLLSIQERFHKGNISVIVEGVESVAHYNKVAQFERVFVQGFLWPDVYIDFNGRVSH
ncbi:EAL domain-containing protein [Vibrio alginolyticus]|uniref:EAL domain-containing protein n=1 Tax=Vibrio alginolyticus TaxID=663 RepID=UPI00215CB4B3|nr:EAL domain-containing protein [Vibrio alginolyticus]MCS0038320.1 EAL domain-containing protein [Vibrio alginolyticus]